MTTEKSVVPGNSHPPGARVFPDGVNFSVYAKDAESVELLLFESPSAPAPNRVIKLDPNHNRSYHYWHCFVPGLTAGQVYGYRVHGPHVPEKGLRFDGKKVLLDPYTLGIANWENYSRKMASQPGDNCPQSLRGVVINPHTYDWEGDVHPRIPYSRSVIYEMHVGGFTRSPTSGIDEKKRGTYSGLIEKIPYLKELGVTAVELLPVHAFDENDAPLGLSNYWGYSTINFFTPHVGYASSPDPMAAVNEFRDMVKALHRAGIEVILDVVYNHTAEGSDTGPTVSYRGFSNDTYYILGEEKERFRNFSGCGNSVNGNHPVVAKLILDSLRYWTSIMHVDGFRFDLASVLMRDTEGQVMERPYSLWAMECDSGLAGAKLIAEAWDAEGLYSVGWFINRHDYFAEWNGTFRDDVRRFVKGDERTVWQLGARMMGSSDIYVNQNRDPNRSINFVTCHDGFTLNDLVTYDAKHNEANLEDSRDGSDLNFSWNCGVEGPSDDPVIERLRLRQIKNLFLLTMLSQGTPMILMGDEVRRTQKGNNNTYGHNNELNWFDWTLVEQNADLLKFVKRVIEFSQTFALFSTRRVLTVASSKGDATVFWHGTKLNTPDWGGASHSIAFTLLHPAAGERLHFMLNSYWKSLTFALPPTQDGGFWGVLVDTFHEHPGDIYSVNEALPISGNTYEVGDRSVVILIEKRHSEKVETASNEAFDHRWFS